jgi:hypothetical protein
MFASAHASNVLHPLADRLPPRSDPGSLSSTTHLRTGRLATTPRRRHLALTAPTRSADDARIGARAALPPPAPGRGVGTATGQSPRARCQDSRILAAAELIKDDRSRSANYQRRPRAPMPVQTSNQGAESKRWLVPLLARRGCAGSAGRHRRRPVRTALIALAGGRRWRRSSVMAARGRL